MTRDPIFLTDGTTFVGPYGPTEDFAIMRGTRTLREGHGATEVFAVAAETVAQAKATFARQTQRKAVR